MFKWCAKFRVKFTNWDSEFVALLKSSRSCQAPSESNETLNQYAVPAAAAFYPSDDYFHRLCVNFLLPAGCREAANCRYCFYSQAKNQVFRPAGATRWSNFAVPTGIWVRFAVQNFTSIGADWWECGPQNIKNFHFLVKSRFPWPISKIFRGFYTANYPTLVFQISCDSHHRLRSYCGETARR